MRNLIQMHGAGWLSDLEQRVAGYGVTKPHCNVYGLIDMAFSYRCYKALKRQKAILRRSLFDLREDPDPRLAEVSPTLIQLSGSNVLAWQAVMKATDGWPMLSLMVTPETIAELARRLEAWCVVDADGEHYCLRFADTRRLPDILSVLTPEQHGQLVGPASAWLYRDRAAQWASLALSPAPCAPAREIRFNSEQCAILIESSEADEIIAQLSSTGSWLPEAVPLAEVHPLLCRALRWADQYVIRGADRTDWCELWLRRPGLEKQLEVSGLMKTFKGEKMSFSDLLSAIEREMSPS